MRKLFIVVAKFMGFWMFYTAVNAVIQLVFYLSVFRDLSNAPNAKEVVGTFVFLAVSALFSLVLSWLLIIKTAWLADKFKIDDTDNLPEVNAAAILSTGIKLIGIYIAVFAISKFAESLGYFRFDFTLLSYILALVLRLGFGFFLAVRTEKVIKLISRENALPD